MEKILYEDKFCELTPECLRIKCYYFPTGACKEIDTAKIEGVYYVAQNLNQCCKVKTWGITLSPCWWACDLLRGCHCSSGPVHYNVVIDCGETLCKGFTVTDINKLLSQLTMVAEQALFMEKIIYEDKWCELTPECLRIKCYYFPTGACKEIDTDKIEGVYYVAQNLNQCCKVKQWGMALSPCWWACDMLRGFHPSSGPVHYNVVIDCGETLYKGFTVIDICDLLSQLTVVAEQAIFVDELPF